MTGNIQHSSTKDGNDKLKVAKWGHLRFEERNDPVKIEENKSFYTGHIYFEEDYPSKEQAGRLVNACLDLFDKVGENRVVMFDTFYFEMMPAHEKYFTHYKPIYKQNGIVENFKRELRRLNRKDLIWSEQLRENIIRYKFLFFPCKYFEYIRTISIMQEKMDNSLMRQAFDVSTEKREMDRKLTLTVYPQSNIIKSDTDDETIKKYYYEEYEMFFSLYRKDLYFSINPKYLTYRDFLKIAEPIFLKYNLEFTEPIYGYPEKNIEY